MLDFAVDLYGRMITDPTLGWMLNAALKGAVILVLAVALCASLRNSSAARRHLVWTLAVIALLFVPLGSSFMPELVVPVPTAEIAPSTTLDQPIQTSTAGTVLEGDIISTSPAPQAALYRSGRAVVTSSEQTSAALTPMGSGGPDFNGTDSTERAQGAGASPPQLLFGLWLAGVAVGFAALLLAGIRIRRFENRAGRMDSGRAHLTLARLASDIGLTRLPVLLRGDATTVPMTWGLLRPRIVLPDNAEEWAQWRIEAVLLHELGHIARRDYLAQLFARAACVLHWFNPMAWYAAARMRVEREHACDDFVLASGHEPSAYAHELVNLARALRPPQAGAMGAICFARPNRLRGRLVALMDASRDRRPVSATGGRLAAAMALSVMLVLGAVSPAAVASEDVGQTPAVETEFGDGSSIPQSVADPIESSAASESSENDSQVRATDTRSPAVTVALNQSRSRDLAPHFHSTLGTSMIDYEVDPDLSVVGQEAVSLCGPRDGESRNHTHSTTDDVITIEMEYDDCRASIRIEEEIEFNEDFTDIESLSSRGFLRIEVLRDGLRRRLEVRPGSSGQPQFNWTVDGSEQAFDASARQWYAGALLDLFRVTSYKARERAAWLLGDRGVEGVLAEVENIWAGHVQARYLTVLLEEGELDQTQIRRVFTVAGTNIDSDHSLGMILAAAAEQYSFDAATRTAFIDAAASLESDHQHGQVLGIALSRGDLSQENLEALLESASTGLESDHQMAEILADLATRYPIDPALRGPFLRAAATLESDHQQGRIYGIVLEQPALAPEDVAAILEAATTIDSDHQLAELLIRIADQDLADRVLRTAFLQAARSIQSDHNRAMVLERALLVPGLQDEDLAEILSSAGTIDSDHQLAQVLRGVAEMRPGGDAVRASYLATAASIESDHSLGETLGAFVQLDLNETQLIGTLDLAEQALEGDHQLAELLVQISNRHQIEGPVREAFLQTMNSIDSRHQRERVASEMGRR